MSSLAALVLAATLQEAAPDPGPRVREIEIHGARAFDREAVLGLIRLHPGDPLGRAPEVIAQGLTKRYRLAGYPAARVGVRFDEGSGLVLIEVNEGNLVEVVVVGLEGAASRRAIEALRLETGKPLREGDIWSGIARLDSASEGTVHAEGDPPYTVEAAADGDGARVVFHLRRDPAHFELRPWGPRAAGRYNRVDGLSLGLVTEVALTDVSSYNHLRLMAQALYAFGSHRVRYTLGIERPFGRGQRYALGYEFHDLTDSEDAFRRWGLEEAPGGSYNRRKTSDLFRRLGHEAYAFARVGARAQVGLAFRSDGYTSLPVATDTDEPNPAVEEGRMRSIVGTVRFASRGDLYPSRRSESASFHFPSLYLSPTPKPERWRVEATYEVSRPGLGSDFDFARFIGRVRLHRPLFAGHLLDAVAYVGTSSGSPPLPKRFLLGGLGTLRGFERKQFTGKSMVLAIGEWSWFPPSRFVPAVIPFYDGGALWGGGVKGAGWKHDAGLGLRWPQTSRVFARVDAAVPFNPEPGQARKVQWNLRLQFPF
jgi:hypothetical protein